MNNEPRPDVRVEHEDGTVTTIRQFSNKLIHTKPKSLRERKPFTIVIDNVVDKTNGDVRVVMNKVKKEA